MKEAHKQFSDEETYEPVSHDFFYLENTILTVLNNTITSTADLYGDTVEYFIQ